ncbi:MAG: peptidase M48 Ste24p [Hydrogenophilales bacterium 12-61-10]|nr:MAG: peptidase M48 Ste24p [Hydrogenophilales bacterium 12-61-10]OYX33194.1 MAG: peptidase M48 Ste24p [Hydrogenophilales bacterium 32-62-9]
MRKLPSRKNTPVTLSPIRRIALIALGALSLTHCASNPVSDGKDSVLMSEQQELQLGAQARQDLLREYAALTAPALQAYVNAIGQKLAQHSERPDLRWTFTVLDSPDVNAFALPGGSIYLTRGLLAYLNSEAELAGVLGHEIGHVTARHGVRQQSPTTAGPGAVLGSTLVPGMNSPASAGMMQSVAQAWTAGDGREHELESSRLGAQYLAKSGYEPRALIAVIGLLKDQALFAAEQARREGREPHSSHHGTFDTHPRNDARLKQVVDEANPYRVAAPREGRAEYLQKIDGLVFGDSPAQGIVRDNTLLHEQLGFAIRFPPGWRMSNKADRVLARSPQGDAVLELQRGPKGNQPLATLQNGLKLDPGARFDNGTLSGFPAAFAAGTQQGKPVVVASVVFNDTQYLIAGMTRDKPVYDRERTVLRSAINSFHAITPAERRAAQPGVLKTISAKPGMTMASLAKSSVLGRDAESQLRLLNHLYPAGEPKPGQRLKIVQ